MKFSNFRFHCKLDGRKRGGGKMKIECDDAKPLQGDLHFHLQLYVKSHIGYPGWAILMVKVIHAYTIYSTVKGTGCRLKCLKKPLSGVRFSSFYTKEEHRTSGRGYYSGKSKVYVCNFSSDLLSVFCRTVWD